MRYCREDWGYGTDHNDYDDENDDIRFELKLELDLESTTAIRARCYLDANYARSVGVKPHTAVI